MVTFFDAAQTARLLNYSDLAAALSNAVIEYANGAITAPERQVVPFPAGGLMLSMPATARDMGIHKLVNVTPGNRALNLPTIHGVVSVFDGETGRELFALDGPTVTARRTAALSMLGLKTFLKKRPERVALIGAGKQAIGHAEAIAALFPDIDVTVVGTNQQKADAFVASQHHLALRLKAATATPENMDAIITLTTSKTPVYSGPAQTGRLVLGVGAFEADSSEIAADVLRTSQVYVDDPAGARHEAGDIILANVDWANVQSLSQALTNGVDFNKPIVFKSVGCAAWDLAAARCARARIDAAG